MSRVVQFQTNFTVGELDPLLRARTDLEQYKNGLETAENVIIQPQGGLKRRPGTEYIFNLGTGDNAPTTATWTDFRLVPFEFSVDDRYLLVFTNQAIWVFKDDQFINVSGSYITTTITAAMLPDLRFAQAVDTLIICHEDLQTKRLVRNADNNWTYENLPISFIPKYAYALDTHEPQFTITPSAVSGNITITASAATTDTGAAQAGTSSTITLKAASSFSSDDQPNGMFIKITAGTGSGQTRHVEDFVGSTKVLTVYPDWATAPDNTSSYSIQPFFEAAVDEYAVAKSGFGRARYVEFVSNTVMKAYVEIPFFDTDPLTAGNWESEHGYEDTWSSTRGWPRTAAFREGRLYFGGSMSRPNTVWGSKVVDYFNFDTGTGLDDEGLEATLNTKQLNTIIHINSGPDLQIFTTGGEFVVAQANIDPITPSTFLIKPQSRIGCKPGVPIDDLAGATIFVQRLGKSILSFQYNDTTNSYGTQPLSLLSSHLLSDPIDLSIRRASSTDETDRLFLINNDGSMIVYSLLASQNVIAPSKFTTDGQYLTVASDLDTTFVVVKRVVNGLDSYYLEKFDDDLTVDCCVTGAAASQADVSHLRGKTVQIIRDGIVEAEQSVPTPGGSATFVTFGTPATTSHQVGQNYSVTVKTLPAEPRLAQGSVQSKKKRIVQVDAIVNQTQNMTVNGKLVSFRQLGSSALDGPIQEFTGTKTVHGTLGFSQTGQITISQTVPLKMNLLGLEYHLSVGN